MNLVGKQLGKSRLDARMIPWMAPLWVAFLLATWLINEWVTRRTEWRTRFGRKLTPEAGARHPIEFHGYAVLLAQAAMVAMYGVVLYVLQWPLWMQNWPLWLGFNADTKVGNLPLAYSLIAGMALNLTPFLVAILLSWIPKRRLLSGTRRRLIPLKAFLDFEARLSWFPLAIWLALAAFQDFTRALPHAYTDWAEPDAVQVALSLGTMVLLASVALPLVMVYMWRCTPLPDGELKERLHALMKKSGVKVRKIMVWGSRDTGMLNACVFGPWARFRYVLISPSLVDELSMEETEAVLAHELAHARHGHLTLFFSILICLALLIGPLSMLLPASWRASPFIASAVILAFVAIYVRFLFGAVMRHCEREADLTSAEIVGSPIPIVVALEKLALKSGNTRNVYSWHHGSIAQRVDSVMQLSYDPDGSARVHAQIRWVRAIFIALAIVAAAAQLLF